MKEQNSWVSSEGCKELWGTAGKLPVWGSPQLMVSWGAGGDCRHMVAKPSHFLREAGNADFYVRAAGFERWLCLSP